MGDDGQPLVSVVIASVNGLPWIARCLAALGQQDAAVPHEVLVVDRCGEETREALRRDFPGVHVIAAESGTSIPALRAKGFERASGSLVAVLADVYRPARGWLAAAGRTLDEGRLAVGGAIESAAGKTRAGRAAYLCEYARFMPPLETGEARDIPGGNALYGRNVLEEARAAIADEAWEFFLHRELKERGVALYCDPDLLVFHDRDYGWLEFLSQRYHHSRSLAARRLLGAPFSKRLFYACLTPLLPPLLLLRIARAVARKGRVLVFVGALPVLLTFVLAGAWGEAVGAICGVGRSSEKVR